MQRKPKRNNGDFYRLKNQIVNDAYDRLVAYFGLFKERDGIKTVAITGCEPSAGATTIAVNLSISMAAVGWKTLLFNADMKKDLGTDAHAEKLDVGLSHYLKGDAPLEAIIIPTNLENLSYISSGRPEPNTVDLLYSKQMLNLIAHIKEAFDIIIFDVPSINAIVDASIIASKADVTILVAKQNATKIQHIENAKRELDHVGAKLLGIIMNKVDKTEYKSYLKNYNYIFNRKKAQRRSTLLKR